MGQLNRDAIEQKLSAPSVSRARENQVIIRGRRLMLDQLLNTEIFQPEKIEGLKSTFQNAQPFEHLVLENLFDSTLLDLIHEEFDIVGKDQLKANKGGHEKIFRAQKNLHLGPASHLYFSFVNSGLFLDFLAKVTSTPGLVADVSLRNGGLHETRAGGKFDVHLDYAMDDRTLLQNRIVFLTYLNRDWLPEYGGDFELWNRTDCVTKVAPTFGRSVFFLHSDRSFHGHPHPLTPPPGRTRRSVASYYYHNAFASTALLNRQKHSRFLVNEGSWLNIVALKNALQAITPPILWQAIHGAADKVRK